MPELWDVYDARRRLTGRVIHRGDAMKPDDYHLVVQVWIRNSAGEWLISRRAPDKSMPLKWEPTGGSVLAGEDSLNGALREVREELGIQLDPARGELFCSTRREAPSWANPGFLDVWVFFHDCDLADVRLQPEETCEARWVTAEEIRRMIARGEWIPLDRYDFIDDLLRRFRPRVISDGAVRNSDG